MIRVGVIGPQTSVERIISIGEQMDLSVLFFSYAYQKVKETEDILHQSSDQVDLWIFSGKISYTLACNVSSTSDRFIYIDHTEAGIFKALIEFEAATAASFNDFSIDEISKSHLNTALKQLPFEPTHFQMKTFSEDTATEELVQFHQDHWVKGVTKGAITCYEEVYVQLQALGIPAFRIATSDIEIRHTLTILSEKIQTLQFKDSQVAVQLFEIMEFENYFKGLSQTYQLQFVELRLKEILIKLSEKLNGYLIERGLGRFMLFSSRGDCERELSALDEAVNQLILESGLKVGVGIGYGETVYLAELNGQTALRKSKEQFGSILIMQEDGFMTEAEIATTSKSDLISFNENFNDFLEDKKVNANHYIELFSFIRKSGLKEFTVKELARGLARDERNMRRFIETLCEVGLAEATGNELYSSRGRPRKMYRLLPIITNSSNTTE